MAQEFLNAAEQVLRGHRQPLLIKDIVQMAIDQRYLNTNGSTPINTMRARLSEHIRKLKEKSIFIRVARNSFALREWNIPEYKAKPLEKNRNREKVVCIAQELVDKHKRFFGFSSNFEPLYKELADIGNIILLPREDAKNNYDIKQLVSYVTLKDKRGKILSFVRGNYGQKESLLKGVLCIGFGGHVSEEDIDLFSIQEDAGVKNSAYREIGEEVKGLQIANLEPLGVINDDSSLLGLNHLSFVFEARLPKTFNANVASREMSINQLKLLSPHELWERFHELEFWSQLLVKRFLPRPTDVSPVYFKTKNKRFNKDFLVVVGEIGSGKTEVSNYLSRKYKLPLLPTRRCVEKLINMKDFGTNNRTPFQDKARELVATWAGIERLAEEISKQAEAYNSECVIIDGVRNLGTLSILKSKYPSLNLMYIDVPRDTAYRLFYRRSGKRKSSIHEFRESRNHEVEREITLFKTRADVYVFNGGTLKDLYGAINRWWNGRKKA